MSRIVAIPVSIVLVWELGHLSDRRRLRRRASSSPISYSSHIVFPGPDPALNRSVVRIRVVI